MDDKKPSDWCQEQIEKAKDGESANIYKQLKELWEKRDS